MATPQVAGLVALMRSAKPSISAARIVRLIKLTASGCGHYGTGGLGWGLIRSDRAVAAAAQRDILAPNSRVRKVKVRRARGRKRARSAPAEALRRSHRDGLHQGDSRLRGQVRRGLRLGQWRAVSPDREDEREPGAPPRSSGGRRYRLFSIAVGQGGQPRGRARRGRREAQAPPASSLERPANRADRRRWRCRPGWSGPSPRRRAGRQGTPRCRRRSSRCPPSSRSRRAGRSRCRRCSS